MTNDEPPACQRLRSVAFCPDRVMILFYIVVPYRGSFQLYFDELP